MNYVRLTVKIAKLTKVYQDNNLNKIDFIIQTIHPLKKFKFYYSVKVEQHNLEILRLTKYQQGDYMIMEWKDK